MYGLHTSGGRCWRRAVSSRRTSANVTRRSPPTRGCSSLARSSGPEARSALTRVADRPREREPSALAGRRGPGRQQAQWRLPKARQRRAAGTADHNAGLSRAWRCAPLAKLRCVTSRRSRPAIVLARVWRSVRPRDCVCPTAVALSGGQSEPLRGSFGHRAAARSAVTVTRSRCRPNAGRAPAPARRSGGGARCQQPVRSCSLARLLGECGPAGVSPSRG
jgi:hypothetical protein